MIFHIVQRTQELIWVWLTLQIDLGNIFFIVDNSIVIFHCNPQKKYKQMRQNLFKLLIEHFSSKHNVFLASAKTTKNVYFFSHNNISI